MDGKELFDKYTDQISEYSQTLLTAAIHFGHPRVYSLLEDAEIESKEIRLIWNPEVLGEPTGMRLI